MKYLHQLKNLGLPKGEFVIFGSGPLAIRGIRENHDIDILVTESLWKKFAKHYAVKRTKRGEKIQIKDIEIIPIDYEDWSPEIKSPQEVLEKAEIIEGLPFVNLDHFVICKKKMGRKKDLEDIKLLKKYLKNE